MIEISYLGHSSFKIRGKKATIVTDPVDGAILNLAYPAKIQADVVLLSQPAVPAHSNSAVVEGLNGGSPLVISGPGEYEVAGVAIAGFTASSKGSCGANESKLTIYQINLDEAKLVYLGLVAKKLSAEQVANLANCQVLFVPVGGVYSIGASEAAEVIAQLGAKVVVPMHYDAAGLKFPLGKLDQFLEQEGIEQKQPIDKLTILTDKLPDETEIVILNQKIKQ